MARFLYRKIAFWNVLFYCTVNVFQRKTRKSQSQHKHLVQAISEEISRQPYTHDVTSPTIWLKKGYYLIAQKHNKQN